MEKKLRRKILKEWSKKVEVDRMIWAKCIRCGKVHGYTDVGEFDLEILLDICVKELKLKMRKD